MTAPHRNRHAARAVVAATALLTLAACAGNAAEDPDVDRPAPSSSDAAELARSINRVGFDVFHASLADGENTSVSPLSIGMAFGLLDAGASGEAKAALENLYAYPATGDGLLQAFNSLEQSVSRDPSEAPEPAEGEQEHATVTLANRVFTDTNFAPLDSYREVAARYFGAGAQTTPMSTDPEQAAHDVNSWVEERTEGLIPKLLSPDFFSSDSRVVLVNSLYLKAAWGMPFDEAATTDGDFTLPDGSTATVPMMYQGDPWGDVAEGEDFVAVAVPYAYNELEMIVIVPDEGAFDAVEASLDQDWLTGFDAARGPRDFTLAMPRFTTEASVDLRAALEATGHADGLFDTPGLDGIATDLVLSGAVHATKVVVDESGTEAAAATALGVVGTAMPTDPPLEIRADQPFLYVIRDVETGAVMFVGRVVDPR